MKRLVATLVFSAAVVVTGFTLDKNDFIDRFATLVGGVTDYQTRVFQRSESDGKSEIKIMNYYYTDPGIIRVDVVEGTRGAGTTGILRIDGKVVARPAFYLFGARFVFEADNPTVTTNRGRTFEDASLAAILESLNGYIEYCEVVIEQEGSLFILTAESCGDDLEKRVVVEFDKETLLPYSSRTYEYGREVEAVFWLHYQINSELHENIFDIRTGRKALINYDEVSIEGIEITDSERRLIGLLSE